MESFFFNITDTRYKVTDILKEQNNYIKRVDISNGVVFLDAKVKAHKSFDFTIDNIDRMIMIYVVQDGEVIINEHHTKKNYIVKNNTIGTYASSLQNFTIANSKEKDMKLFILFFADFFLKRYLSSSKNEPIDYLYTKIQDEIVFEHISTQPTNALSLYIIDKIISVDDSSKMSSIRCEHNVVEFLIHRLSLCEMFDNSKGISEDEYMLSKKAKNILLKNFVNPITIPRLAHLCATNESKLKKVFKKINNTTIHHYVQKLKLEEANLLLREQNLSIGKISATVGYSHQGHFSKLFFKTYGVYPKDLLKN